MAKGDFATRLRAKFSRRASNGSSLSSNDGDPQNQQLDTSKTKSLRSLHSRQSHRPGSTIDRRTPEERIEDVVDEKGIITSTVLAGVHETPAAELEEEGNKDLHSPPTDQNDKLLNNDVSSNNASGSTSAVRADAAAEKQSLTGPQDHSLLSPGIVDYGAVEQDDDQLPAATPVIPQQKPDLHRRQSLLPPQQQILIRTLLQTEIPPPSRAQNLDYFTNNGPSTITPNMVTRKIWVKKAGASATLVSINEDDLVDDVREMILKKYANSLGRAFDAPDVSLKLIPRDRGPERVLGPEEPMWRTLDLHFPGGQTVNEALVIDVPPRRTPRPSPRGVPVSYVYADEGRPAEAGTEYFPVMPVPALPSPQLPHVVPPSAPNGSVLGSHHPNTSTHAMSVLITGQVPALPSPGSSRRHYNRPRALRHNTASPTVMQGHIQTPMVLNNGTGLLIRGDQARTHSEAEKSLAPPAPPLPSPPAELSKVRTSTPPPRVSSPRPGNRTKKSKKAPEHPSLPAGMLNGAVPPINVLIVEDNIINLKLLEAFMKRLKVRWQTAMNGKEAVTKWRGGGFHLVLMDIQLPVMNGLEATREIRRLEKLNSIGVFSSSASSNAPEERADEPEGDDKLPSTVLFKSPVIIVALTASSLQSDRHEALAAGCNDFLTKPVNFVWLERKVMEWGCMQALIDFDGWRKWKDFSQKNEDESGKKSASSKSKSKKNRNSMSASSGATTTTKSIKEEVEVESVAA